METGNVMSKTETLAYYVGQKHLLNILPMLNIDAVKKDLEKRILELRGYLDERDIEHILRGDLLPF